MTPSPAPSEISYLDIDGGQIAYEVLGQGPLVVLSHGMGDLRQSYRFVAPLVAEAGYRVATPDMRGHGDSSLGWPSISRTDVANDLVALIRHLGGPAVIVGQSLSGGSATIAAAQAPDLVRAIVEINPFTRVAKTDLGAMFRIRGYRRGGLRLMGMLVFRSLRMWLSCLDVAYPTKPADWDDYTARLRTKLSEPGRMGEFLKTMRTTPADAEAQLANVGCPALVVMGTADPDFPTPRPRAGRSSRRCLLGQGPSPRSTAAVTTPTPSLRTSWPRWSSGSSPSTTRRSPRESGRGCRPLVHAALRGSCRHAGVGAEAPAGALEAQQADQPTVGVDHGEAPPTGRGHHLAGPRRCRRH